MRVSWRLQHHGWAVCALGDEVTQTEALVSYVTDGAEEFLTAVARLVLGWSHARVNGEMNRLAGVTRVSTATTEQLQRRLRYAESWLRRLRRA